MHRIVCSTTGRSYYHYDDRVFKEGELITGNRYNIPKDILQVYSQKTGISSIDNVLYMLDHEDEEYLDTYGYGYKVEPQGKVLKCAMDYSIVMCNDAINGMMKFYMDSIGDMDFVSLRNHVISLMSDAYLGDYNAAKELNDKFDYTNTQHKVEFICNKAKVLNVIS